MQSSPGWLGFERQSREFSGEEGSVAAFDIDDEGAGIGGVGGEPVDEEGVARVEGLVGGEC